jgi:phenylpropionate dioxygenase-like ring-hydroxylating dioxygenase large terminal subunit
MRDAFEIDADISRARTLPASVYHDASVQDRVREAVFARSWQYVPAGRSLPDGDGAVPFTLLPGVLDEPLVLTRAGENVHCLSNVCTHRANLVVSQAGPCRSLRCRYHGRRFGLDGRFQHMPEFEGVAGFPTPDDDLARVACASWGPLRFVSLAPERPLEELLAKVTARVGWLPWERCAFDPHTSRDYPVQAHWALYCDNYLEGFHIRYVHPALARALDPKAYRTELFDGGSLQVGIARGREGAFDLPNGHRDVGQRVAAYYFWIFPNLMLNFYPWGLSLNLVRPIGLDATVVSFESWVLDDSRREAGAGAGLHQVEMEDEEVVQSVQHGVRSRFYERGRYSPTQEEGVHHFHRLLAECLRRPQP